MAIEKLYNFAGQTISIGSMWSWTVSGYPSWMYAMPNGYTINPFFNGAPFNLITYFKDVVGEIPTTTTYLFFDDNGQCEATDATFVIWAYNYNGRMYFGCQSGNVAYESNALSCAQAQATYCIYPGCDPSNVTQEDINNANVWIYENNVPDDGTLNGSIPDSTNVSGDRWRLMMLGWGTDPWEGISPGDEYVTDQGEERSGYFVPKANEGSGQWGGYYPRGGASRGWHKYADAHIPTSLLSLIETWEDVPQETGGGGGSYGYHGEYDPIGALRELDFADLGFTSMYGCSAADLKALSKVMWDDNFLDAMEKSAVGHPMDAIISLTCVPLSLANIVGAAENCYIGKFNTNILMNPLTKTSIRIDCGEVAINETWGTATDYASTVEIYIPFVGMVQVNISEVMGGTVHLYYDVNLMSGDFCAKLVCVNRYMGLKRTFCIYQHEGNLQTTLPVTGADYTAYYKNRVGGAAQIISSVASGIAGMATANPMQAAAGAIGAVQGAVGGINQMLTPPTISRSGNLSGASALMAEQVPKVIVTKHNQYIPKPASVFGPFKGMPAFYSCKVKDLRGYNALDSIKLDNFPGTTEEMDELTNLLMGGVYFG